jgi:hypothetical protein
LSGAATTSSGSRPYDLRRGSSGVIRQALSEVPICGSSSESTIKLKSHPAASAGKRASAHSIASDSGGALVGIGLYMEEFPCDPAVWDRTGTGIYFRLIASVASRICAGVTSFT